jgi:3-hydroxy-5-methyl-1-naphthoate 3-O-methyltransferase
MANDEGTHSQRGTAPDIIYRLAYFYDTKTFLTSVSLGIYTALSAHPLSSQDLSKRLSLHPDACEVLLNALVALELLHTQIDAHSGETVFANTPVADTYLVEGRPEYMGDWLRVDDQSWDIWGDLEHIIRGYGRHQQSIFAPSSPEAVKLAQMYDREALTQASKVIDELDVTDESTRRVLDIGGGGGRYAAECCKRGQHITATVFDRQVVRPVFDEVMRETNLIGRMTFVSGDLHHDVLPRNFSLALLFDVLHLQGPAKNRDLLWRVRGSLEPGGRVAIKEVLLNDTRTSPRRATLFSVNMMAHFPDARCYSAKEIAQWLGEAGFDEIRVHDTFPGLMTARVPSTGGE